MPVELKTIEIEKVIDVVEVPVECVVERRVEIEKPVDHFVKVTQFVELDQAVSAEKPQEKIVEVEKIV